MKTSFTSCVIGSPTILVVRIGTVLATALLLTGVAAAEPSPTFRFALPDGVAILYGKASNPQAPLLQRVWQQAVFRFPNGTTFGLLPRSGQSDASGTQMEPPNKQFAPSDTDTASEAGHVRLSVLQERAGERRR
jgi:hypothetical protein